jgi:hypothetical protein
VTLRGFMESRRWGRRILLALVAGWFAYLMAYCDHAPACDFTHGLQFMLVAMAFVLEEATDKGPR